MATYKGIISFPAIFTPSKGKKADKYKFSLNLLLPPGDPQIADIQSLINTAKAGVAGGYDGEHECLAGYDEKYKGKDYYNPAFSGWSEFSCGTKGEINETLAQQHKPSVVGQDMQPIIDPSKVFSGCVGFVNAGLSYYPKGKAGIGGWLNGVMITDEEPPMGRLDGKPSVEQMFAGVGTTPTAATTTPPPTPVAPAPATLVMTAKAEGVTYEAYVDAGWSDEQMVDGGLAIKSSIG